MKNSIAILSLICLSVVSCLPTGSLLTVVATPTLTLSPSQIQTALPTTQANMKVTVEYSLGRFQEGAQLSVQNHSSLDAEDLKVQICISQLAESWQPTVKGISSIVIEPDETALAWQKYYRGVNSDDEYVQFQQEYSYDDSCYPTTKNKTPNSVKLSFKTLSANNGIYLKIKIVPDTTMLPREDVGVVYIKSQTNLMTQGADNLVAGQVVGVGAEYLNDLLTKWVVGQVSTQIACDNCPTLEATTPYTFIQDRSLSGCKLLSRNGAFARVSCGFAISYFVPSDLPNLQRAPEEIYLFGLYDNYKYTFLEITKDEFLSEAP